MKHRSSAREFATGLARATELVLVTLQWCEDRAAAPRAHARLRTRLLRQLARLSRVKTQGPRAGDVFWRLYLRINREADRALGRLHTRTFGAAACRPATITVSRQVKENP